MHWESLKSLAGLVFEKKKFRDILFRIKTKTSYEFCVYRLLIPFKFKNNK